MNLKECRNKYGLTIEQASIISNVPKRTYIRYKNDDSYGDSIKRNYIINSLVEKYEISEEKGILTLDFIKETVSNVFSKYGKDIECAYLFGSYAKGYASDDSDVDICISTDITGLDFVGIIEELRVSLHKVVDLIRLRDLKDNLILINEILKDGIKIYG